MYDVIVVSAGTAGSSTAMLLARRGYQVLLVDRPGPPGDACGAPVVSSSGLLLLDRWGLLEPLLATGCPTADTTVVTVAAQTFQLNGRSCTPRRSVLEALILGAARLGGAEVRERFTVKDVVWDHNRVSGIVGSGEDRHAVCEQARIVIGADGRESIVGRAVGTSMLRERPSTTCCYQAYWRNLDVRSPELHVKNGTAIALAPTGDGLTDVLAAVPIENWARYKRSPEHTYRAALESVGWHAASLAVGARSSRFFGTADLAACVRRATGPGWALVGDAARHAGGVCASGAAHALLQAELLATAVDESLSGRAEEDEVMADYEMGCELLLADVEDILTDITSGDGDGDRMAQRLASLERATEAQLCWAGGGRLSPGERSTGRRPGR